MNSNPLYSKTFSDADFTGNLSVQDFAKLFGCQENEIPSDCLELIKNKDFRYKHLSQAEKESVLLDIWRKLDTGDWSTGAKNTTAGAEGKWRWEKGWQENLDAFKKTQFDLSALVPKYIRPKQCVRLNQNYVLPKESTFEMDWYSVFRRWIFRHYLADFPSIYEYGCGTGFNVAELAQLYPEKKLYGLDWAAPSAEIVNSFATHYGWKTKGHVFDFFQPDYGVKIDPGAAVFTIGALEQTGENYHKLLDYFLKMQPALVVHVEPIVDWYDPDQIVDYAAIRNHQLRRYLVGYPGYLKKLEDEGKIQILKMKRSFFGSLFMEGYSQIVWKPTGA